MPASREQASGPTPAAAVGELAPAAVRGAPAIPTASAIREESLWVTRMFDLRDATDVRLQFQSWSGGEAAAASIQVSTDGRSWQTLASVPPASGWARVDVDLSTFSGQVVWIRFVFDAPGA